MSETSIVIPEPRKPRQRIGKLGRKMEAAISALIGCKTLEDASAQCDVSVRTLRNWQHDPVFMGAYRDARRACLNQAIARVQSNVNLATEALIDVMKDAETNPVTRVQAAKVFADFALRSAEWSELDERLRIVEKRTGVK